MCKRILTTPQCGRLCSGLTSCLIPAIGEKMDCLKACTNGGPTSTISGESLPRYTLRAIAIIVGKILTTILITHPPPTDFG